MGRPREFDDNTVTQALMQLFWRQGYDGTSYADIMTATGLKKGSLYAAYGDKRALYAQALGRYESQFVDSGIKMLSDTTLSANARIAALFDSVIASADGPQGRWGCLLCNAATEPAPHDPETDKVVSDTIRRIRGAIEGALPESAKAHTDLILSAYFGARTVIKSGLEPARVAAMRDSVLGLIPA